MTSIASLRLALAESMFNGFNFGPNVVPDDWSQWFVSNDGLVYTKSFWPTTPVDDESHVFTVTFSNNAEGQLVVEACARNANGRLIGRPSCYENGTKQLTLEDTRRHIAEHAFASYEFGEDAIVAGTSGWEYCPNDNELSRSVFVEIEGEEATVKWTFVVRFEPGSTSPEEVYARDRKGNDVGTPFKAIAD